MINIAPTIFYFRFIFSVYSILFFKLIWIIFSPGLCSWRYHRWCLAGTQPLVCSVYCFLCCTFHVVMKKKNYRHSSIDGCGDFSRFNEPYYCYTSTDSNNFETYFCFFIVITFVIRIVHVIIFRFGTCL